MSNKIDVCEARLKRADSLIALATAMLMGCSMQGGAEDQSLISHGLPPLAAQALDVHKNAVLYSLYADVPPPPGAAPKPTLDGWQILGRTALDAQNADAAAAAYRSAVLNWRPPRSSGVVCDCGVFFSHFALEVTFSGHRFDFIGFDTGVLDVFEDDQHIVKLPTLGSPTPLVTILRAANVQLDVIYTQQYAAAVQKQEHDDQISRARWLAATPKAFLPLWPNSLVGSMGIDAPPPQKRRDPSAWKYSGINALQPYMPAFVSKYPSHESQILELLNWYGSGQGPWNGFPAYETIPSSLLDEYGVSEVIDVIKNYRLSPAQREGAARYFSNDIDVHAPAVDRMFTPKLKAELLNQASLSRDPENIARARAAFSD